MPLVCACVGRTGPPRVGSSVHPNPMTSPTKQRHDCFSFSSCSPICPPCPRLACRKDSAGPLIPSLHLALTPSPPLLLSFPPPFHSRQQFLRTVASQNLMVGRSSRPTLYLCGVTDGDRQPQVAGILLRMGSSLPPQGSPFCCWAAPTPRNSQLIFSSKSSSPPPPQIPFTDLSSIFRKTYMPAGIWGYRDESLPTCPRGCSPHGRQTRVQGDKHLGGRNHGCPCETSSPSWSVRTSCPLPQGILRRFGVSKDC